MQEKMEILAKLEGLENLFNEKFETNGKDHQAILEQVKKNNSRTSKLECWQNRLIGGLIVSNIIILPVLFMVAKNWLGK